MCSESVVCLPAGSASAYPPCQAQMSFMCQPLFYAHDEDAIPWPGPMPAKLRRFELCSRYSDRALASIIFASTA